ATARGRGRGARPEGRRRDRDRCRRGAAVQCAAQARSRGAARAAEEAPRAAARRLSLRPGRGQRARRVSGRFLDTNVLVYLASADRRKADIAERLLADGGTVSVQVLNEL